MTSPKIKSLVLTTVLACSVPLAYAPAQAQTLDYNADKTRFKAVRVDTVDELGIYARSNVNKSVEVRGTIKGIFSSGANNFSMMLQIPDGETLVLSAPNDLRQNSAIASGKWVRAICKITACVGTDIDLSLQNATDTVESQLIDSPNYGADDIAIFTPNSRNAPSPDRVLIAPEVNLPPAPTIVKTQSSAQQTGRGQLPSRRAIVPRNQALGNSRGANTGNPYFGFTDAHRVAYKNLARRTNPRLSDEMADSIARAILSAAQTHNLDPRFLAAVVTVESQFNPYAVSSAGAMGLGQLMPFNLRPLGVGNAWDPMQNLHGSAKMLRQNLNTYSRMENGTLLAVAAYHAGVGAVNRAGYKVPKISTNRYAWKVYYAYKALAPELF